MKDFTSRCSTTMARRATLGWCSRQWSPLGSSKMPYGGSPNWRSSDTRLWASSPMDPAHSTCPRWRTEWSTKHGEWAVSRVRPAAEILAASPEQRRTPLRPIGRRSRTKAVLRRVEVTLDHAIVWGGNRRGSYVKARVHPVRTPRMKRTTGWPCHRVRRVTLNNQATLDAGVPCNPWNGGQQGLCVWMTRWWQDFSSCPCLRSEFSCG